MEKDLKRENSPELPFPDSAIGWVGQLSKSANNSFHVGNSSFPEVFHVTSRSGASRWFGGFPLSKTNKPSRSRIWFIRFVVFLSRSHPLSVGHIPFPIALLQQDG